MDDKSSVSKNGISSTGIGVGKAVLIGHLVVSIPVLIIMFGFAFVGRIFALKFWLLFLLLGIILAWLWWSFAVPRWRRWALRRGAPADRLQKLAAATGLVWPKGWIFEKTEFKVGK